ncbi:hypothetical protein F5Y15DRAFT_286994 [Xylariaceae sp. FL0016]|nr:hypothetical protein F5Y15DRAFT_286994 [Xylariaceae sp. FL0016]
MKFSLLLAVSTATMATASSSSLEMPAQDPVLGQDTIHGCYSSSGELRSAGQLEFNSQGLCAATCTEMESKVGAMYGETCYCGEKYPNAAYLVDDDFCNEPCPGFADQGCGGNGEGGRRYYTVLNTGLQVAVGESDEGAGDAGGDETSSSAVSSSASVSATAVGASETSSSAVSSTSAVATSTPASNGTAAATSSATATPVSTGGAVPQLSYGGLELAALGLGVMLFL